MKLRYAKRILFLLVLSVALWSCGSESSGVTIKGNITGSENLQVFVDHVVIGKANSVIAREQISGQGTFDISFEEGLEPGIYNVRIGAKRISLVVDDQPGQTIEIDGNLNTLQNYEVTITGSDNSQQMANIMQKLIAREMNANDITQLVETSNSPMMTSYVAFRSLGANGQYLETHRQAQQKLAAKYPDSEMTVEYARFIETADQQYQRQVAQQRIRVGAPAPEVSLPSPDGKTYNLSDLKGQIVLLDFWASWCRPCRMENPNVVKVYEKYKNQGFTVFSVSLDGVDPRLYPRMSEDQITEGNEQSRQKWINAIAQDRLSWPYHVSDLRKFQSVAANVYGVRSIPRAFLIDREGNIASIKVRGAEEIETAVLELLASS
ncbi:MAG: TlpA family protein disulfide reductase [Saprospiraceae bacterium]|nr:TlpA family protein disulfide reductase [Saprospiraceae bacterium]